MSEQLSREQRRRLIDLLATLTCTQTEDSRRSLLAGLPLSLRGEVDCTGSPVTALGKMIDHLDSLGTLDSGESALAIFVENAWETVKGTTPGRELEDILNGLGGGASRLAELRRAYAEHLRGKYAQPNLRGLLPAEHLRLLGARIMLHDIYVPLLAAVTTERRDLRIAEALAGRLVESGAGTLTLIGEGDSEADERAREPDPAQRRKNAREHVPLDSLGEEPVVIILGNPGAGKSTFLKRHALALLDGNETLPIMVPLAAYAQALVSKSSLGIADFAATFYEENGVPGLRPLFAHARRNGQAVYLLDGLDEVASDWRGQVGDRVVALARSLGAGNRLIATSRITGYIPLALEGAAEATLEPFNPEQIAEFVRKWYAAYFGEQAATAGADKTAEKLLEIIRTNPGVAKLADNPLTLTMLALLFFAGNEELPRQRIRLYRHVANTLIGEWHKARSLAGMPVGGGHDELEVLKRVGPLAYWMHDQKPEGLATRAEIEHLLVRIEHEIHPDEDPLPGIRRFLDRFDVGLLAEKGVDQWGFAHLTFEEYFAAREIARRRSKMAVEIARRAPDPRWTEVIRLAIAYVGTEIGDTEDATALVEDAILKRDDPYEPYLHRNLLLAGRVLADDPNVEARLSEAVARQVFDLLLTTEVRALRESAGEMLREMLGTRLRAAIVRWAEAAIGARQPLGYFAALTTDPAIHAALLPLLADKDRGVRRAVVRALAGAATDPAVRAVLLPLLADPEWDVRRAAVAALAGAATDRAVRAALLPLLADKDRGVRRAVVRALAEAATDPAVRAALLPLLADTSEYMRFSAVAALAEAATDPAVRAALLPLLADKDRGVRRAAVAALAGAAADPAIHAALLPLLADKDGGVRRAAVAALAGATTDRAVRAALLPLLADKDRDMRRAVVRALTGAAIDSAGRAALLPLLADPEWDVREAAMAALAGAATDPAVRAALLPLLADKDGDVRGAVVRALAGAATDPAVRVALLPLLADKDGGVREAAVAALAGAATDRAVRAALLPLLADKDRGMRFSVAEALAEAATDPTVRAALLPLLADKDGGVRGAAVAALANSPPDPDLYEQLGNLLKDSLVADAAFATLARWAEVENAQRRAAGG